MRRPGPGVTTLSGGQRRRLDAALGIAISSLARNVRSASGIVVVPFLILQSVSGVFVPVVALPDWVVEAASLFPLLWMAQGLRAEQPGVHVLVLTTYDTDADILRAVEADATGYLLKDTPRAELAEAVRTAARGETVLTGRLTGKLFTGMRQRDETAATLSPREVEVLRLASEGRTNAALGRSLHISATTVETHLMRVYDKLGVGDRTAAVPQAIRRGLLSDD